MILGPEQRAVDNVARCLNGGKLLIPAELVDEIAPAVVVARYAFQAGKASVNESGGKDSLTLIKERFLPDDMDRHHPFARAYDAVVANAFHLEQVLGAFAAGAQEAKSG